MGKRPLTFSPLEAFFLWVAFILIMAGLTWCVHWLSDNIGLVITLPMAAIVVIGSYALHRWELRNGSLALEQPEALQRKEDNE